LNPKTVFEEQKRYTLLYQLAKFGAERTLQAGATNKDRGSFA